MVTKAKGKRKSLTSERACSKCGEVMPVKMLASHRRWQCTAVIRSAEEGSTEVPPGTIIGEGPAQHKKAWTWRDLEKAYPESMWITQPAQSNPPGGITWNGLHLELVPFEGGCFITTGSRNGERPVYHKGVPPPHWFHYQESLKSDRGSVRITSLSYPTGQIAGPQVGTLEPQIFVETETGERLVNPY